MTNEELALMVKQGVDAAENMAQLFGQTEKFIIKIANKYKRFSEMQDLVQEGYIGLYKAVQHYNPVPGVKFLSYAGHWINQAMSRYIDNYGNVVRIPAHSRSKILQYDNLVKKFSCEFGMKPTEREICQHLDISPKQLKLLEKDRYAMFVTSTDVTISEDNDLTIGDTIAGTDNVEDYVIDGLAAGHLKDTIWTEVEHLPDQQGRVLKHRYQDGMSPDAVACITGATKAEVRSNEAKGLRMLKNKRNVRRLAKECDIIATKAYSGGISSFNRTWTSSTEYAALKLMELGL